MPDKADTEEDPELLALLADLSGRMPNEADSEERDREEALRAMRRINRRPAFLAAGVVGLGIVIAIAIFGWPDVGIGGDDAFCYNDDRPYAECPDSDDGRAQVPLCSDPQYTCVRGRVVRRGPGPPLERSPSCASAASTPVCADGRAPRCYVWPICPGAR